ncbi:hypothetical protein V8D89_002648 [Ganoderma adspersum]
MTGRSTRTAPKTRSSGSRIPYTTHDVNRPPPRPCTILVSCSLTHRCPMGNDDAVSLVQSDNFVIVTASLLAALLIYDHLLTFDREVRYIWSRGLSGSSFLYYAIRYPSLVYVLLLVYFVGPWEGKTLQVCPAFASESKHKYLTAIVAPRLFSGLRAYALCERRRGVLVVIVLLALVNPLTLMIEVVGTAALQIAPFNVCKFQVTISARIAARACTIAADMSVLAITWIRTFPEKIGGARMKLRSGIAICMLEDAKTTTWVLICLTHLIAISPRFTALLSCRFLLDLHEAAGAQFGRGSQHSLTLASSSIEFQSRDRAPDRCLEGARSVFGATLTWDTQRTAYTGSDDIELDETTYVAPGGSQDNVVDNV